MGFRVFGHSKFCDCVTFLLLPLPCLWFCATSPTDLSIVLGTNSLNSPSLEMKAVTSIILHKNFTRINMDNDIALLLLDSPITFSELKEPICMPTSSNLSSWRECWVAGWGQTQSGM